jgi:hypothetical protein
MEPNNYTSFTAISAITGKPELIIVSKVLNTNGTTAGFCVVSRITCANQ